MAHQVQYQISSMHLAQTSKTLILSLIKTKAARSDRIKFSKYREESPRRQIKSRPLGIGIVLISLSINLMMRISD